MNDATGGHNGWLEGGAAIIQVETTGQSVIEGFTIVNGYADGGGGDGIGDGGGMLIDEASPIIRDCVFESNEAFDEGGGLYVMDGAPQVIDCDFGNGLAGSKGGGISLVRSAALLQGCDVHGNASSYNGGGLHLHESEALLDGCFIRNNQAGDDGGGLLLFESVATLSSCEVSGNTCEYDGAGIAFVSNSDASVSDCIITGNTIASAGEGGGWGGGLYCYYSSPNFTGCTVSGNTSNTVGGGLASHWSNPSFVDSIVCGNIPDQLHNVDGDGWTDDGGNEFANNCSVSGTITVCADGCDFADIQGAVDHAVADESIETISIGEGVYTSSADAVLTLPATGLTLRGTTFDADGVPTTVLDGEGTRRGILVQSGSGGTPTVIEGLLVRNGRVTNGNGGGVLIESGSPSFVNCHFMSNQASTGISTTGNGGGVYCAGSSPSFTDCVISGNTAQRWGGGVALFDGSSGTFNGCRIDSNGADNGGGFMLVSSDISMASCSLQGNSAGDDGGGVLFEAGGVGSFTDCQIRGNSSGDSGGGLDCQAANSVTLVGCVICGNVSEQVAGSWTDGGGNGILDDCRSPVQWRIEDGGNGHWYQIKPSGLDWQEANASAESLGGYLVSITSQEEQNFLESLTGSDEASIYHIGGYQTSFDQEPAGNWAWSSGEPFVYSNWGAGEPNDGQPDESAEHYMAYEPLLVGGWADVNGNGSDEHIIEWSADCNGDGVVDCGQILDGTLLDEDGDGVPDCCDSAECLDAMQWRTEDGGNGHWYQLVVLDEPTNEPGRVAGERGGHPATLTSPAENQWVFSNLASMSAGWTDFNGGLVGPWIGLGNPCISEWWWITGEMYDWTNWASGQPVGNCGDVVLYAPDAATGPQPTWAMEASVIDGESSSILVEWSNDCDGDGVVDYGQILTGERPDLNGNGIPDGCETPVQWRTEDGGNGHWYRFSTTTYLYRNDAQDEAVAAGGHLVTLTSSQEDTFVDGIIDLFKYVMNHDIFTGGLNDGGGWTWVTGESWGFQDWGPGQPASGPWVEIVGRISAVGQYRTWGTAQDGDTVLNAIFEWSADCNEDGIVDYGQILDGSLLDDDGDGVPNECESVNVGVCCLDGVCVELLDVVCDNDGGTWISGLDCSAVSCTAGTYSVCADGCDFTDIQSAIDHAVFGGVIEVGPGTWDVELVASGASIEFRSTAGWATTWLDGGDSHRIFLADDEAGATIKFVGFTFANGDAGGADGGALYVDGNALVLEDCRFVSNRAQYGGAVACRNGSLTMTGCIVGQAGLGNVVPEDGGGIHFSDSTLLISGTTFDANSASQGGGLMAVRSAATIDDCLFTANLAMTPSSSENQAGGAIEFHSCPSMSVTGCEFVDNEARDGGALCLQNPFDYPLPAFVIDGCLFDSNLVDGKGGAIYIGSNAGTVDACEFLNNDAGIIGSAIFIAEAGEGLSTSLTYSNSLFCGSGPEPVEAYDEQPILIDGGGNTIIEDVGDCVVDGSSWIGGGDTSLFSDQANWLFGAVPGTGSDVRFNLDEVYQIDFDMDADSRSIDVSAGDVTFDLGGHLYEIEDDIDGDDFISSLRVQRAVSQGILDASLTLTSSSGSGELRLQEGWDIDIANADETIGAVAVEGDMRLVIDGDDGKLRIGTAGQGALRLSNGAQVEVPTADIGDDQGSFGLVEIRGSDTRLECGIRMDVTRGRVLIDEGTLAVEASDLIIYRNGTIVGDGIIDADVLNYGTLSPDGDPGGRLARSLGSLRVKGSYAQEGILEVVASDAGSSWLQIDLLAELGGALIVNGDGSYNPDGYALVLAPLMIGEFDVALMPSLSAAGKYMSLRYGDGLRGGQDVVEIVIEELGVDVGFDPLTPPQLAGIPGGLAVGDLAGDNSADDIAVAIAGSPGSIEVYLNDGTGGFGAPDSIMISQYDVGELIARDVDGDGDADLLGTNRSADELLVIENLGGGAYAATPLVFETAADPIGLGVVDLHPADGVVDFVAVACNGANSVQLFRNTSGAGLKPIEFQLDDEVSGLDDPIDIDPIDENEDKDIKLLVTLRGPGEVVMLARSAVRGGSSLAEVLRADVGDGPTSIVTGHLNDDGNYDVVTTNPGDGTISVLVNSATGSGDPEFRPAVNLPVGSDPRSITLVDLDGDGDLDIALAAGEDVTVLRNDSDEGSDTLLLAPAENLGISGIPLLVDHGLVDVDQQPDIVTINAPTGRSGDSYESISLRKGDDVKPDPCEQSDITGGSGSPDGTVNVQDLLLVIAQWNCSGSCVADIDSSGAVGVTDLLLIISWWGECGN